MSNSPQTAHIFMVSFPGQGHVNPLLRFGRRLADFGLFITFCAPESAAAIIHRAHSVTGDDPTTLGRGMIRFEFFDDSGPYLTSDLSAYIAHLELVGREKLPQMIRKQEELGRPVSCFINNPFIPWVSDVAESLGIPSALLWVQSCACFSAYYHCCHNLVPFPNDKEPEIDVQLPFMPLLKHDEVPSFLHPGTPYPSLATAILGQFRNLSIPFCVLMDTFQELEHENIQYMSKISRPIKTIGPLFKDLRDSKSDATRADVAAEPESCTAWLESKPPRTVVYVSFGTVVDLKQEQVEEIALGLLCSEVSFLLVLRPPSEESKAYVLPEGFVKKIGERGKIVQWSPQEEVLAHSSTACFVTHCGWNSTMEALTSGVPVVAFPQWGDQVTNAKFLVDVYKVGIRMGRGEAEGKVVTRDEVAACLKEATAGPKAEEIRENALRWKKTAEEAVSVGGSSYKNMQDFVNEIVAFR
ncbi:hypothetical protein ACS0TY_002677 [Phlomoides rotata]